MSNFEKNAKHPVLGSKIRKGDKVYVITGKDKGKTGSVLRVYGKTGRVLIQGINLVKKHVKPGKVSKEGGIINVEKSIAISNVMLFNDKLDRPVRLGFKLVDAKKYRLIRKNGEVLEK
ncbi:50S ribosomal protein L24 [candidate division WWE3 bacterium]|uniref:Large ribosomal subunit protein uL24 n=1 Tax=candidate division WWE3 bacterium TaxID=2053526 RepID=A0A7X9HHV0_UNCKA|nr:50S ribosomal protein L24 [candidate division WWE3 bacterium]